MMMQLSRVLLMKKLFPVMKVISSIQKVLIRPTSDDVIKKCSSKYLNTNIAYKPMFLVVMLNNTLFDKKN